LATTKLRRNTLQRQIILDELRKLQSHPTASQLYGAVRQRLPKISLGTVYRNLELLSQVGMIQKMEYCGTEARYDGVTDHHYHVRCHNCGRIDDLPDLATDLVDENINDLNGYEILGHRLEFLGLCPHCQNEDIHDHPNKTSGRTD
jgi:Fur family ferric uptake transcriptional regulator